MRGRAAARLTAVAVAAAILVAGLAVRAETGGAFAKYAGVALYATFGYALVVCVVPRVSPLVAGAVALAWCWGIEFAQLTPVPAALSAHGRLARLVFGTTFNAPDLAWYVVGIAAILGPHWTVSRWAAGR
jgi:hypothetical protein